MPDIFKNITGELGVNRLVDDRLIDDREVYTAKNLIQDKIGTFKMRKTLSHYCNTVSSGIVSTDVPCSGLMIDGTSSVIGLLAYTATPSVNTDIVCADIKSGSVNGAQTLSDSHLYEANPIFVDFGQHVYILSGKPSSSARGSGFTNTGTRHFMWKYDKSARTFTSYTTLGVDNANVKPCGACEYLGRMVYWNLAAYYEDCLVFSDRDAPLTIPDSVFTQGWYLRIGDRSDGAIVACIAVQLTEVADGTQTGLLVLKERAAYLITGEPSESTDTTLPQGSLSVSRINTKAGCVSYGTVCRTTQGVFWLGEDDVWMWRAGSLPVQVGTKIRSEIIYQRAQVPTYLWKLHAAYFDGYYRLALYNSDFGGGTIPDGPKEQWWLDLRSGPPSGAADARWFGPQVYVPSIEKNESFIGGVHCMVIDERLGEAVKLLAPFVVNTTAGAVKCALAKIDDGTTADVAASTSDIAAALCSGNKVRTLLLSKDYDLGEFGVDKIFTGLEVGVLGSGLVVSSFPIINNVIQSPTTQNYTAGGSSVEQQVLYPDSGSRLLGKSVQMQISHQGGYVIDSTNDMVSLMFDALGGSYEERHYSLTQGIYTSIDDLLDMVMGILEANESPNWSWSRDVDTALVTVENADGVQFYPRGSLTPNTAQVFWDLIGFTSGGTWASAGTTQTGDTAVAEDVGAAIELDRVTLRVNPIPRRL